VRIEQNGKEICLNSLFIYEYFPYLLFALLVLLLFLFSRLLDARFGKTRKKRYKRAVMEVLYGLAAVLSWLAGGDIILLGVQGGVFLLIGLLRYAKFGKPPSL